MVLKGRDLQERTVTCPMCGAPIDDAKRYSVDWDENRREFKVLLAFHCWPCDSRFDEELIKRLPLLVATNSLCSCGATLNLSNHTVRRTKDDEVEFEALYVCQACASRKRSIVTRIKHTLHSLWRDSTKIEIGPGGIKYEKAGGASDAR